MPPTSVLVLNETGSLRTGAARCSSCGKPLPAGAASGSNGRCARCTSLRVSGTLANRTSMILVRCIRCGRSGRVSRRVLEVTTRERISCPRCRSLPGAQRMIPSLLAGPIALPFPTRAPLGTVAVQCAKCRRRGYVPAHRAEILGPSSILCPGCRGQRAPLRWTPPAALRAELALERSRARVGRPPEILSRAPARPGPAVLPRRLAVAAGSSVSQFEVRCFRCGRYGRLPVRPGVSLRPEEIICPSCRRRPAPAGIGADRSRSRAPRPVPGAPVPA